MTRHMPEQARREQILSAARRCFIDRGYHPTRMDDIAKTASLSKGGVYFHFKSKREVFDSLVKEEFDRAMTFLTEVTGGDKHIAEKLQVLGTFYLDYFKGAPDAPRFFIVMGEMALRDPEVAAQLREMQGAFIREVEKLIQQGVAEGVLRNDVDHQAMAAVLKALLDGAEGLTALEFPMEAARLLGAGLDLVMNGLVKRG